LARVYAMGFPWFLLRGKWILVGHEAWAKDLLVAYLVLHASRDGHVYIEAHRSWRTDLLGILSEKIVGDAVLENIFLVDHIRLDRIGDARLLVYIEPAKTPYIRERINVVVSTTPGSGVKRYYGWRKALLKRVGEREFLLVTSDRRYRITLSPDYIGYAKPPQGVYGEALKLLRRGIVEYGSLTTRDAIDIIAYNLGVKRDQARKILGYLVEKGYIAIRKGELLVY